MAEIYGQKPFAVYKKSDPNLSFSKMSLDSSQQNLKYAYLAGLIDGEGCIGIQKTKKHYYTEIAIGMSEKAKNLLECIQNEFGGTINQQRKSSEKWSAAWKWRIGGEKACLLLLKIRELLMLKSAQAETAIQLYQMLQSMPMKENGTRHWTKKMRKEANTLKMKMHQLNMKGSNAQDVGEWYQPDETLFGTLEKYSQTWPKSGMIVNGHAYRLHELERITKDHAYGYWPTPRTRGLLGGSGSREMVQSMVKNGDISQEEAEMILGVKMYPTPQAFDAKGFSGNLENRKKKGGCKNLKDTIGGSLNAEFVEFLMGVPIGWSALLDSEMPKFQSRQQQHFDYWLREFK